MIVVIAVLLVLIVFVGGSSPTLVQPTQKVQPLTADPGIEILPDLSPDGTLAAYCASSSAADGAQLTLAPLRGGGRQVLGAVSKGGYPRWSPDGKRIAAFRGDPHNEDLVQLALFSLAGDAPQSVTTLAGHQRTRNVGNSLALDWKRDGTAIAFTDLAAPQEAWSLYEVAVDSGFRRRLTQPSASVVGDVQPVYSPDRRWLAFVRLATYSEGDIYLLPADGGDVQRLTSLNSVIDGLTWLPDSSGLILSTDRGSGNQSLWRMSLAEPDRLEHVTGGEANATYPSSIRVDEEGTATLVYQSHLRDVNVWRHDLGPGGFQAAAVTHSTWLDYNPQFSPDGRQLAFISKRSGSTEVWVSGTDGSNPRQLSRRNQGFTDSPRWSPDGKWIAFTSNEGPNRDIYIVPSAGGSERRLIDDPSDEGRPSWSGDGRSIYFRSDRGGSPQIWKVPSQGGNPVQVTLGGGYEGFEAPDGKTLFYVRTRRWTGLWEAPVDGGPERLRIDGVYQTGWAVTRDAIYYVAHPSTELFRWDFRTRKSSPAGRLGEGRALFGYALSVSFDGGAVAYSQIDTDSLDLFTLSVPQWQETWR